MSLQSYNYEHQDTSSTSSYEDIQDQQIHYWSDPSNIPLPPESSSKESGNDASEFMSTSVDLMDIPLPPNPPSGQYTACGNIPLPCSSYAFTPALNFQAPLPPTSPVPSSSNSTAYTPISLIPSPPSSPAFSVPPVTTTSSVTSSAPSFASSSAPAPPIFPVPQPPLPEQAIEEHSLHIHANLLSHRIAQTPQAQPTDGVQCTCTSNFFLSVRFHYD